MREEVFGSACGGFGVDMVRVGEVGAEVGWCVGGWVVGLCLWWVWC